MLKGFRNYLETGLLPSVFDEMAQCGKPAVFHCCDGTALTSTLIKNSAYEVQLRLSGGKEEAPEEKTVSKIEILFVCRAEIYDALAARLNHPKEIPAQPATPPRKAAGRHHIKNKTLFPLMEERQVVWITLLNGMVLRGLVSGFNRYEISLLLKGGVPVTVLRHAVLNAQNKDGRSLLKADQETLQDWKKSPLYEK